MSFLNKFFGNSEEEKQLSKFWRAIESEDDLSKAVAESFEAKVAIFKHSRRCFISKLVLKNFEKEIENSDKNCSYRFLDLLAYRNLSDKIAKDFGVEHQSPQLIILENGIAINHASHQNISLSLI